jgi:RNA polymerase sigma factor (sigma-70 family)
MPIGMYIILIGTFVYSREQRVVLTHKSKPVIIMTIATNSEVSANSIQQDLIEACRNGDQKAQFQIYKLYYRAMYNTSLRIVNDTMEAEDIMQESFLSAFEHIKNYSGTVSFGAWLKSIVQNRSLDALRKKRKQVFENIDYVMDMADTCTDSLSLHEEVDPRMNRVMEIINRLPEKCRNIFSLYFLEGYDHDEISDILSISGSTSRSQLSRARIKIITEFRRKC